MLDLQRVRLHNELIMRNIMQQMWDKRDVLKGTVLSHIRVALVMGAGLY